MPDSHVDRVATNFSADPSDDEYRPVSTAAVLSVVLGVLSAVVLVADHAAAWFVPALGAAAALVALRRIAVASPPMVGRKAALVGLCLSVALLSVGPANRIARTYAARHEARRFAEQWISALQAGQRRAAHEMTLPLALRCPADQTLSHCYRNNPQKNDALAKFTADPAIKKLLQWGDRASIGYAAATLQTADAAVDRVGLVFRVEVDDPAAPLPGRPFLRVLLERGPDRPSGTPYWHVVSWRWAPEVYDE